MLQSKTVDTNYTKTYITVKDKIDQGSTDQSILDFFKPKIMELQNFVTSIKKTMQNYLVRNNLDYDVMADTLTLYTAQQQDVVKQAADIEKNSVTETVSIKKK